MAEEMLAAVYFTTVGYFVKANAAGLEGLFEAGFHLINEAKGKYNDLYTNMNFSNYQENCL